MKNSKLTLAILAMVVATLVSVVVVSCKKDIETAMNQTNCTAPQSFDYRRIEDEVSYFTDFKKRMKDKENATFNLDDAAWHLACLANMSFCNINVKYDDFLFDTIGMQVDTEDGSMMMSEIGVAYDQMCTKIKEFKNGFDHCDQNLYYINVSINNNGIAKIVLVSSITTGAKYLSDHPWYFSDLFEATYVCYEYFSEDSVYYWDGLGATELARVLNIFEHHENGTGPNGAVCYFPTRNHTFDYTNTFDPYSSGYYYINESRVFAKKYRDACTYALDPFEMCYCLDSYLGLGYDYINDNLYDHEYPVCWAIVPQTIHLYPYSYWTYYHQLLVEYGRPITIPNPNS